MPQLLCANCDKDTGREVVSVKRTVYRNMGDRDHDQITDAFVACSWRCAAAKAAEIEATVPPSDEEPW